MWSTSYSAETDLTASAVWAALRDLHSGIALGPHSDHFELHGPFAVGTEVSVTPQGQQTLRSVITELEDSRRYADSTVFGDLTLTFRHRLEPTPDGGTRITHELQLTGPTADQQGPGLGPEISADFPTAMAELLTAARERSSDPGARARR